MGTPAFPPVPSWKIAAPVLLVGSVYSDAIASSSSGARPSPPFSSRRFKTFVASARATERWLRPDSSGQRRWTASPNIARQMSSGTNSASSPRDRSGMRFRYVANFALDAVSIRRNAASAQRCTASSPSKLSQAPSILCTRSIVSPRDSSKAISRSS
jgi:hypothetical protein